MVLGSRESLDPGKMQQACWQAGQLVLRQIHLLQSTTVEMQTHTDQLKDKGQIGQTRVS